MPTFGGTVLNMVLLIVISSSMSRKCMENSMHLAAGPGNGMHMVIDLLIPHNYIVLFPALH